MHTTNYTDTLILPAPDTKAQAAVAPPTGKGTVAELQYERLAAEVQDLREGLEMVEERARTELGMVRQGEIYVQVTPGRR